LQYCKRCVLPDTKPGLILDEDGICSACRMAEIKKIINWKERQKYLKKLCNNIKGSNGHGYDCIVPVSGGKDSIYQLHMMKNIYGLRVLAVNISAHIHTPEGLLNINSMIKNIDVDFIKVAVRPSTHRKIRKMALIKTGNPNYAEHRIVFSAVARAALFYNVPLVVWGEDIATEFGGNIDKNSASGSAEELINNDLFREIGFEELVGDKINKNELFFYDHPKKDVLKKANIRSIYLGYYHWWDGTKNYEIAKQYGFISRKDGPLSGNYLDYDNIDERLCEIHIWLKFIKLGFWRPTDQCCYKIWNGYMKRDEAVEIVNKLQYEFPREYFKDFLDFHDLNEDEFWKIIDKWRNKEIWHKVDNEWRLRNELK
jgi:N-acetyl sugar amidotransferase